MTQRKNPPGPLDPPRKKSAPTESAFDIWLNRGLHQLFDDVTKEPVPESMLKLLFDDDKKK